MVNSPESTTIIRPTSGWALPNLAEIFAYRDLLFFLTARNVKVRYRQTVFGVGWAVLQPLLNMAVMTIVFGKLIGVSSDGQPYWAFCLAGVVLWSFISQAVTAASSSIVANTELVEKVYFPRLVIPLAAILACMVDLFVSIVMLIVVLAAFGGIASPTMILCFPIAFAAAILVLGVGAALSSLVVRFRDVAYLVPFALQAGLFATPIVYPLSIVPERWQLLMALNPATGLVEMFRWAALGSGPPPLSTFAVSMGVSAILLLLALLLFRRVERSFADVI